MNEQTYSTVDQLSPMSQALLKKINMTFGQCMETASSLPAMVICLFLALCVVIGITARFLETHHQTIKKEVLKGEEKITFKQSWVMLSKTMMAEWKVRRFRSPVILTLLASPVIYYILYNIALVGAVCYNYIGR